MLLLQMTCRRTVLATAEASDVALGAEEFEDRVRKGCLLDDDETVLDVSDDQACKKRKAWA